MIMLVQFRTCQAGYLVATNVMSHGQQLRSSSVSKERLVSPMLVTW